MSVDVEIQAVGVIIDQMKNNQTLDMIAQRLTQDFNKLYGREWFCFIGKDNIGSHFVAEPQTQLWFFIRRH